MAKDRRLRKGGEFERVLKEGRQRSSKLLLLGVLPNGLGRNRYGFSVGKGVGKAVQRNLVKRRLRAAIGEMRLKDSGWDVVVIARRSASEATYQSLREALRALCQSVDLLGLVGTETTQGIK